MHEGHSLLALVRRKRLVSERLVDMGVVDRVRRRARALDGVDGRLAGSEREKVARVVCERGWWGPEWLPRGGALEGGVYVLVARVLVRVVAVIRARVTSIFCRGRVAKSVRCFSEQSRRCGHHITAPLGRTTMRGESGADSKVASAKTWPRWPSLARARPAHQPAEG